MATSDAPDLTVLQWIKGEIDQSLQALTQQLRGSVDAAGLTRCAQEIHRLGGALQMAGVQGLNHLCDAMEGVLNASTTSPDPTRARALVIQGMEALGRYIGDLLHGAQHRAMRLYPLYRDLRLAQGHDKVNVSDLFHPDLGVPLPPWEGKLKAGTDEKEELHAARKAFQRGMLVWLRGNAAGLASMRSGVARLDALRRTATGFWWTATAFLECVDKGGLSVDSQIKKLCARIDAQLGRVEKGSESIAEGLHRELLYFISVAPRPTPAALAVATAYGTRDLLPETEKRADDQLSQHTAALHGLLREAKEHWSVYCDGDTSALAPFGAHLTRLVESATRDAPVEVGSIAQAITTFLALDPLTHDADRRIAVAGALLVAEEALLAPPSLRAAMASRVLQVIRSLGSESHGADDPQSSAVSSGIDSTLVAEIMKGLRQVEQHVSAFLRDERKKDELATAIKHLHQVENILLMANAEQAGVITRHCLATLQDWHTRQEPSRESEHESFAQALTALDYYLQAKSRGDLGASQYVRPVLDQLGWEDVEAPTEAATSVAALTATPSVEAAIKTELRQTLSILDNWMRANASTLAALEERVSAIYQDAVLVSDKHAEQASSQALALIQQARQEPLTRIPQAIAAIEQPAGSLGADGAAMDSPSDPEIAEVFLEEAEEVLSALREQIAKLQGGSDPQAMLAEIRRGFHTLKGSSRVAGLTHYGEAAWSVERTLNHWLDQNLPVTPAVIAVMEAGTDNLGTWTAQLKEQGNCAVLAQPLITLASRAMAGEMSSPEPQIIPPATPPADSSAHVLIGDGASISTTLFAIFQSESHEHLQALRAEWQAVADGADVTHRFMRAAHTLAGIARTVQVPALADLAFALEMRLQHHIDAAARPDADTLTLYKSAIDELGQMVQVVTGERGLPASNADLLRQLEGSATVAPPPAQAKGDVTLPGSHTLDGSTSATLGLEEMDPELRATFLEEAVDLGNALGADLQMWRMEPANPRHAAAVARGLHTLKGSARAAGALQLGEQVHNVEESVQRAIDGGDVSGGLLDALLARFDRWCSAFEALLKPSPTASLSIAEITAQTVDQSELNTEPEMSVAAQMASAQLRVRGDAIERLADASGELNIARARMGEEVRGARQVSLDLNDSVKRLRGQLREIEIQAESQMKAHLSQLDEANEAFDPLEFDRFTRLQELTRLMAESLHDIGSVQQNLLRHFQEIDAVLTSHTRVNRELHRELSKIQTVPFASVTERLQRVARQTAAELGKQADLVVQGGQVELDRRLLDQMLSPLEHLIRNALAHGIEAPPARRAAGKREAGGIRIALRQETNRVLLEFTDDGAGLDLARIRAKAQARGLIGSDDRLDDDEIRELIFMAGFSTAEQVTEVSGRGVGMDVVRNVVHSLGGEVRVASRAGQGTSFSVSLPLTLLVVQAAMVTVAGRTYGIPASLVTQVMRCSGPELQAMYDSGVAHWREARYDFRSLQRLLGLAGEATVQARNNIVLLLNSGDERAAVHVESIARNQEIAIKEVGPQLSRVPGIAGASIGANGRALLLINPLYLLSRDSMPSAPEVKAENTPQLPLVLVVDDSVTVRKVTSRLMSRSGYRVQTAKDGVDALEQLQGELPLAVLLDIEMPRMDGFELTQHIRADARLAHLPLIMISSRTAEKHRAHAHSIGVNVFLGKPFHEDELLAHVRSFARDAAAKTATAAVEA